MATALVKENAKVYGLARNKEGLESLKAEIGTTFIPVPLDISNRSAVNKWVSETFSADDIPDILINNAGAGSFGRIDEMGAATWDVMVNTNLTGMYNITSQVVKLMRATTEPSHIVNIGSILGSVTRAEGAAYSATKFGMRGFTDALFKEIRNDNIKVTLLNPGSIDTHFFESSGIEAHKNMLQADDIANTVLHILKTPDNMLISELTVRPLDPRKPK
jgi:NADP-dependent 3-hydroxy acid dehydrogenase YdfG